MKYIPQNERRDYVPYFKERDEGIRDGNIALFVMFIVILSGVSLLIHMFIEPVVMPAKVHAEQTGPMTNKEACQDLKEKGGFMKDHMKDIIILCAKEGINL